MKHIRRNIVTVYLLVISMLCGCTGDIGRMDRSVDAMLWEYTSYETKPDETRNEVSAEITAEMKADINEESSEEVQEEVSPPDLQSSKGENRGITETTGLNETSSAGNSSTGEPTNSSSNSEVYTPGVYTPGVYTPGVYTPGVSTTEAPAPGSSPAENHSAQVSPTEGAAPEDQPTETYSQPTSAETAASSSTSTSVAPTPDHTCSFVECGYISASCSQEGKIISRCTCGNEYEEIIPKLEHTFVPFTMPATNMKDGYRCQLCSECGYETDIEVIPRLKKDPATCDHSHQSLDSTDIIGEYQLFNRMSSCYRCDDCGNLFYNDFWEGRPDNIAQAMWEVVYCINQERLANGLNELAQCSEWNSFAQKRAGEIPYDFSHNGWDAPGITGGYYPAGECIASGCSSGVDFYNSFCSSPMHHSIYMAEYMIGIGVGVTIVNNETYCVLTLIGN